MEMSMQEVINGFMNPPEEYQPSEKQICLLQKLDEILKRGNNAEIKLSKTGYTIYEIEKKRINI